MAEKEGDQSSQEYKSQKEGYAWARLLFVIWTKVWVVVVAGKQTELLFSALKYSAGLEFC